MQIKWLRAILYIIFADFWLSGYPKTCHMFVGQLHTSCAGRITPATVYPGTSDDPAPEISVSSGNKNSSPPPTRRKILPKYWSVRLLLSQALTEVLRLLVSNDSIMLSHFGHNFAILTTHFVTRVSNQTLDYWAQTQLKFLAWEWHLFRDRRTSCSVSLPPIFPPWHLLYCICHLCVSILLDFRLQPFLFVVFDTVQGQKCFQMCGILKREPVNLTCCATEWVHVYFLLSPYILF